MPRKPKTVDEYLDRVSDSQRAALEKLRRDIRAAAPTAEECINYDMPSYRIASKILVSFAAAKKHCAFYPGADVIDWVAADPYNFAQRDGRWQSLATAVLSCLNRTDRPRGYPPDRSQLW